MANATVIVSPDKFPPTSKDAAHESLGLYHQIQTWMGKDLPPDEWGWENTGLRENTNTGLRPIKMARPAAP